MIDDKDFVETVNEGVVSQDNTTEERFNRSILKCKCVRIRQVAMFPFRFNRSILKCKCI